MRLTFYIVAIFFIIISFFTVWCTIHDKGKFSSTSGNGRGKLNRNLLIVSTIDGTIRALDENTGEDIWKLEDSPLVSQSIANLEILDNGQMYRLVPSLEGGLFLVDSTAMRPLPITADSLLASSFQLADNSLLVGAQENDLVAVDPETGKILFSCSKEGCGKADSTESGIGATPDFRLVVRRRRHIVRSVDVQTGAEKWNFSMGHNEVAAMLMNEQVISPPSAKVASDNEAVSFTFNVHQGLIVASQRNPYTRILWRRELEASLHKVWRLSKGSLRQLPVLSPGDPLTAALVPKGATPVGSAASCPHDKARSLQNSGSGGGGGEVAQRHYIYFGHYKGQLYVQMEDRTGLQHAYPLPPAPSKGQRDSGGGADGEGQLIVRRVPFRQPPAGFYVAASPGSGLGPRQDLAGLIAGESESLSVEAFGLAGNPTSWWFQSLVLGLFIFVVAHLFITRVLHQALVEPVKKEPSEGVVDTPAPSEAAEKGELLLAGAPVQEQAQCVVMETATNPNSPSPSSGLGPTMSVSASSTTDLERMQQQPSLMRSLPVVSSFESRYANEYTHVRCLGRGGFGVVFEARNDMDGCSYAIKRVCVRDSDENRERLTREVKALARLDHPGIVRYFMAWIERPPSGWQEERDKTHRLLERNRTGDYNSTDWEEESSSQMATSTHATASRPHFSLGPSQSLLTYHRRLSKKRYSDSVEIIFAKQQPVDEDEDESSDRNNGNVNSNNPIISRLYSFSEESSNRKDENDNDDDSEEDEEEVANVRWRAKQPCPEDTSVEIVFQRPEGDPESTELSSNGVRGDNGQLDASTSMEEAPAAATSKHQPAATPPRLYLYIAMQLCATESLKIWLEKNLENRQRNCVLDMFAQIVDAVGYVHRTGMMHRDLKPSNIFFSLTDGRIKIGDFGLAASLADEDAMYAGGRRVTGSSRDSCSSSADDMGPIGDAPDRQRALSGGAARGFRHTDRVGTRLYMSPELEEGEDYDSKVDVFSLGLIFLELLVPFGTHMERVQTLLHAKKGIRPDGFDVKNPHEAKLIASLLHRDPAQRPICDEILAEALLNPANTGGSRYRTFSQSRMPV